MRGGWATLRGAPESDSSAAGTQITGRSTREPGRGERAGRRGEGREQDRTGEVIGQRGTAGQGRWRPRPRGRDSRTGQMEATPTGQGQRRVAGLERTERTVFAGTNSRDVRSAQKNGIEKSEATICRLSQLQSADMVV